MKQSNVMGIDWEGGAVLGQVVREDLPEEVIYEQRPE